MPRPIKVAFLGHVELDVERFLEIRVTQGWRVIAQVGVPKRVLCLVFRAITPYMYEVQTGSAVIAFEGSPI
jgi:hypothetical protein